MIWCLMWIFYVMGRRGLLRNWAWGREDTEWGERASRAQMKGGHLEVTDLCHPMQAEGDVLWHFHWGVSPSCS